MAADSLVAVAYLAAYIDAINIGFAGRR